MKITKEGISKLENKTIQITQSEEQSENRLKTTTETELQGLVDYNKKSNIHVNIVSERKEKEVGNEYVFEERVTEKFLKFGEKT